MDTINDSDVNELIKTLKTGISEVEIVHVEYNDGRTPKNAQNREFLRPSLTLEDQTTHGDSVIVLTAAPSKVDNDIMLSVTASSNGITAGVVVSLTPDQVRALAAKLEERTR